MHKVGGVYTFREMPAHLVRQTPSNSLLQTDGYGADDTDRINRLLRELGETTDRQAKFICAVAIANPDGEIVLETEGICSGEILFSTRGTGGFGYDPIFYMAARKQTFAEMSPETKAKISHRGVAFAQLMPELKKLSNR